jgi:hypothetical protein
MAALREFDWAPRIDLFQLRLFVANSRLAGQRLATFRDHQLLAFVRAAISRGDVLVLLQGNGTTGSPDEGMDLRRLVAQIERQVRDKLTYRGRRHKLVVGDDLANIPGRNSYEVVAQAEARAVLEGISKQAPASSEFARQSHRKDERGLASAVFAA